jgi:predicted deacylase
MSYLQVYRFDAPKKGTNLLILGAVHGNEPCGAMASRQIMEQIENSKIRLVCGSVTFIPVCNPKAFEQNVRQIDENLNRIIRPYPHPTTYEQHLADELERHIAGADVIIDLHSTFSPLGKPFIFSDYPDPKADFLAHGLDVAYVIKGWPEIYAKTSDFEDLSTGFAAHRHGKTALTVECGHHSDPSAVRTAHDVIFRSLSLLGLIEHIDFPPAVPQASIMMDSLVVKEKSGALAREFVHLDTVKKGEILAIYDDKTEVICPQDGYILLPKAYAEINAEWFYLGHRMK